VTALKTIDPGAELFISYGANYWADLPRFDNLPARTQQQIKLAYPKIDQRPRGTAALRDIFGIALALTPFRPGVVGATSASSSRKRTKKYELPLR